MSRIYFHSEQEDAEVAGTERYLMGKIVSDMGVQPLKSICRSLSGDTPMILECLPKDHYLTRVFDDHPESFEDAFTTWFGVLVGPDKQLIVGDQEHTCWTLSLNTAIDAGSDPIKLYAMVHGLCELHGYVEGHNRAWLADIIKHGLKTAIYRKKCGWENVINLLKSDDAAPVVMSYSVCNLFPNRPAATYDDDAWYNMRIDEQWQIAMPELRKNSRWLELTPANWDDYYFGDGTNSFEIVEYVNSLGGEEDRCINR